ncbi:hypothetical protein TNCV_1128061 [Trichonephila clavipes]|nr:hypothetical protein TNCV_1128061 [Trichonephila clavipes]
MSASSSSVIPTPLAHDNNQGEGRPHKRLFSRLNYFKHDIKLSFQFEDSFSLFYEIDNVYAVTEILFAETTFYSNADKRKPMVGLNGFTTFRETAINMCLAIDSLQNFEACSGKYVPFRSTGTAVVVLLNNTCAYISLVDGPVILLQLDCVVFTRVREVPNV